MAVLQMQRISICALKHDRKAILEKLQSMGMIEMHQVAQDEDGYAECEIKLRETGADHGKRTGCIESVYTGEKIHVRQSGRK